MLPLVWMVGPLLGGGLLEVWAVYILQRALTSLLFAWIWQRQRWDGIHL